MPRLLLLLAIAVALHPRPARGQAAVDSAELAVAVARFVAEDVVPRFTDGHDVVVGEARTRFDSLVAAGMAGHPVFQHPVRGGVRAVKFETRGLIDPPGTPEHLRGLPAVVVQVRGCDPTEHPEEWDGGWHAWANLSWYAFRRTERGWEVAGQGPIGDADGVCTPPDENEVP